LYWIILYLIESKVKFLFRIKLKK